VSRLPLVPENGGDDLLAPVFERFIQAGRPVPELYRTLGNAPKMLAAWTAFAWPLRNDSTTDRGLRELVIMRVAQLTSASYEWVSHWPMAIQYGLTREHLGELKDWRLSALFSESQRLVLKLTDELTQDVGVTDETWERLAADYDPGEIVELVLTVAFYSCVSRVLGAIQLEPESDPDDLLSLM
jgi:4-carboxymuconolactone decarboxylase